MNSLMLRYYVISTKNIKTYFYRAGFEEKAILIKILIPHGKYVFPCDFSICSKFIDKIFREYLKIRRR